MYHVSAQGVDERMINVHDYYYHKRVIFFVNRFGLAVRCYGLVSGWTSVQYRFGSPFSSERLWFADTVL